jgi:hypothetical protein
MKKSLIHKTKQSNISTTNINKKDNWSFLNAIDKDKNDTERKDCLKMYNDYNKSIIANKYKQKEKEQQVKEREYQLVQNELESFKKDMHNSSKIKKNKYDEMVGMNNVQKQE